MKHISLIVTFLAITIISHAQSMSEQMEKAIAICAELSNAIGSTTTAQLKAANKELKAAGISNFGDIWLDKGSDINTDGHFIFDEVFVDSLLTNRAVLSFSSQYAATRATRGSNGANGRIKMTTKALKSGKSAIWKTINRNTAEYAIIAEPGGLFTMTIRDEKGNVLYAETINNKKGAEVRQALIQLPDKATRVYIEVKNNSKKDASFALLSN